MHHDEHHQLAAPEAVIAGLLALMTGYSQSLLAEQPPPRRLALARRIGELFGLLDGHPQLSAEFRAALAGLRQRWRGLADCTSTALRDGLPADPPGSFAPPERLQ